MSRIAEAQAALDRHVVEIVEWHFNPETGSPFWLEEARRLTWDPREKIRSFADLVQHFPAADERVLKSGKLRDRIPKGFGEIVSSSPFFTGGTTGEPNFRWGRRGWSPGESDYADDYSQFSELLPEEGFPKGGTCLYLGPGGCRRLRLGVEVLARLRGDILIEGDMDAGWMKDETNTAKPQYKQKIVRQAIGFIRRFKPTWVFCTPILIQAIGELIDWTKTSVRGVFAGGTEMTPGTVQHIIEELFQGQIHFVPTFGNALVGLAPPRKVATAEEPIDGQDPYSVIYQPLQPRTVLRVTKPGDPMQEVEPGERGVLQIYTLTKECFLPGKVEDRDEGTAIAATEDYPWVGVAEIGLPEHMKGKVSVGVY